MLYLIRLNRIFKKIERNFSIYPPKFVKLKKIYALVNLFPLRMKFIFGMSTIAHQQKESFRSKNSLKL